MNKVFSYYKIESTDFVYVLTRLKEIAELHGWGVEELSFNLNGRSYFKLTPPSSSYKFDITYDKSSSYPFAIDVYKKNQDGSFTKLDLLYNGWNTEVFKFVDVFINNETFFGLLLKGINITQRIMFGYQV